MKGFIIYVKPVILNDKVHLKELPNEFIHGFPEMYILQILEYLSNNID